MTKSEREAEEELDPSFCRWEGDYPVKAQVPKRSRDDSRKDWGGADAPEQQAVQIPLEGHGTVFEFRHKQKTKSNSTPEMAALI